MKVEEEDTAPSRPPRNWQEEEALVLVHFVVHTARSIELSIRPVGQVEPRQGKIPVERPLKVWLVDLYSLQQRKEVREKVRRRWIWVESELQIYTVDQIVDNLYKVDYPVHRISSWTLAES